MAKKRVMFISGLGDAPHVYRCLNKIELLETQNYIAKCYKSNSPSILNSIYKYDYIFFFRVPYNNYIELVFEEIKKLKKTSIFDIDDLIFSPDYIPQLSFLKDLNEKYTELYYKNSIKLNKTFNLCDYFITSTDFLAEEGRRLNKESFVHRNCLNKFQCYVSDKLLQKKIDYAPGFTIIGYFSGSNTHDLDLKSISSGLAEILNKYKNVKLLIAGYINLPEKLLKYKSRIIRVEYLPVQHYYNVLSMVDINISPLQDINNPFIKSKSEIKYIETGILKIPTIASESPAFKYAIEDGKNGFLCQNENEWFENIEYLINDKQLRIQMGEEAYKHCMKNYHPEIMAPKLKEVFNQFKINSDENYRFTPEKSYTTNEIETQLDKINTNETNGFFDFDFKKYINEWETNYYINIFQKQKHLLTKPYFEGEGIVFGNVYDSIPQSNKNKLNVLYNSKELKQLKNNLFYDFGIFNEYHPDEDKDNLAKLLELIKYDGTVYISVKESLKELILSSDGKKSATFFETLKKNIKKQSISGDYVLDIINEAFINKDDDLIEKALIIKKYKNKINLLIENISKKINELPKPLNVDDEERIDIVVPIYNGYLETLECIDSILEKTEEPFYLILIDDKSTDKKVKQALKRLPEHPLIKIIFNDKNQGFVKNCNTGMKHSNRDIILLNADTIVTKGWIKKLKDCAYSSEHIATVTPLTNSGTICSVPNFIEDNVIPEGFTIDSFGQFIENISLKLRIPLPTAVGFCMYIKRTVIDEIGIFDEAYGRGYGEENDFSCRAIEHGYINVVDDATFIYHKGRTSFQDLTPQLGSINSKVLDNKYPFYFTNVAKFIENNMMMPIINNIHFRLMFKRNQKPNVIVLSHVYGGGSDYYILELMEQLKDKFNFFFLKEDDGRISLEVLSSDFSFNFVFDLFVISNQFTININSTYGFYQWFIDIFNISLIHVNHTINCSSDIYQIAKDLNIPLIQSIHDYYYICQSYNLLDHNGKYCGICLTKEDAVKCKSKITGHEKFPVFRWRDIVRKNFQIANKIIFPSKSSFNLYQKVYSEITEKSEVIPHGYNYSEIDRFSISVKSKTFNKKMKICILGVLAESKGKELAFNLFYNGPQELIEWYVLGSSKDEILEHIKEELPANVNILGRYEKNKLVNIISELEIDFVFLLSKCPEVFSYTLSEAWLAGIPVLSGPFGALEERIKEYKGGWVLDELNFDNVLQFITHIRDNPKEYSKVISNIEDIHIKSITEMKDDYLKIYNKIIKSINLDEKENLMNNQNAGKSDKTFNNFMFYSLLELRNYNALKDHARSLEFQVNELKRCQIELDAIKNSFGWRVINRLKRNRFIRFPVKIAKKVLLRNKT